MKIAAYAGAVFAVIALIVILIIDFPAPISSADRLQNTPNSNLTDGQITSQTNKIEAVKDFVAKYPNPKIQVTRGSIVSTPLSGNEIEVLYSNAKDADILDGSAILSVLLSKDETYSQDANETHVLYLCNEKTSILPCNDSQ